MLDVNISCVIIAVLWSPSCDRSQEVEVGRPPGLRTGALTSHLPPSTSVLSHDVFISASKYYPTVYWDYQVWDVWGVTVWERVQRGGECRVGLLLCHRAGPAWPGRSLVVLQQVGDDQFSCQTLSTCATREEKGRKLNPVKLWSYLM